MSALHLLLAAVVITLFAARPAVAKDSAPTSPCAQLPNSDHPKVSLRSGGTEAVVYLPDKEQGYYRATRFDWSGVVACVSVHGHKFFGEWFAQYDPLKNDSITGPVEEFRTDNGVLGHYPPNSALTTIHTEAIGYDDARPGETFLKPGVGFLKRTDERPYSSGALYPIVDGGKWTVKVLQRTIRFQQVLNGANGYSYVYTKALSLDSDGMGLTLSHSLKNTGAKTIDTKVYDHDFFVFDDQPAAAGMVVRFKFPPRSVDPMTDLVTVNGNELQFRRTAQAKESINAYITGYSNRASDNDITVIDTNRKIGVRQTGDNPISRILFWTNGTAVCPEVYLHVPVASGKTSRWKIHYAFLTPAR
jgi:hypothetical protein